MQEKLILESGSDAAIQNVKFIISAVQSRSRVQPFPTPWTAAGQASLSITNIYNIVYIYIHTILYIAYYIYCIYRYICKHIIGIAKMYFSTCVIYFKAIVKCEEHKAIIS